MAPTLLSFLASLRSMAWGNAGGVQRIVTILLLVEHDSPLIKMQMSMTKLSS